MLNRDSNLTVRAMAFFRAITPLGRWVGILAFFTVLLDMASEIIYLTAEGLQKLKDELHHMRSVERPAISAAIAEARDKGDLSENAEYDAAREAQGLLEMRIAKLEQTLTNARVIDESKIDKS